MNYVPNVWDVKRAISKVKYKVMNYSDLQSATRLATNDEPWNQSNSDLYQLAEGTWTTNGLNDILGVCIERLSPPSQRPLSRSSSLSMSSSSKPTLSWRSVYKTLGLLEFLIIRGSERVKTFLLLHRSFLSKFVDYASQAGGIDRGHGDLDSTATTLTTEDLNIRKKATRLLQLLDSSSDLAMEREKAQENLGKYKGYSNMDNVAFEPASISSSSSSSSSSFRRETLDSSPREEDTYTTTRRSVSPAFEKAMIAEPPCTSDFGTLIHFDQDVEEAHVVASPIDMHTNAPRQSGSSCQEGSPHPMAYSQSPIIPSPSMGPPVLPCHSPQTRLPILASLSQNNGRMNSSLSPSPPPSLPPSSRAMSSSNSPEWATDLLTLVNDMHVKNTDQKGLKEKSLKELRKI